MSAVARLSVAEYDRMIERGIFDSQPERRIELIYGKLREMNPPGPTHEVMIDRLTRWSFRNLSDEVWVRVQNSIGAEKLDSAPQPDVVWARDRDYLLRRPQANDVYLVIEVSHSSLDYDREVKAGLYASAGIKDYWIVNLCDFCIEVHRKPRRGKYSDVRSYGIGDNVSPLAFPEISLDVSKLFSGV